MNYLQKIWKSSLFLLLFSTLLIEQSFAQLTPIPSPAGYENASSGYYDNPIVVGTDSYMRYYGDDNNYDLAKYDGTALTIIPSPAGYTASGGGYAGLPIVVGADLYMRYWGDDGNFDLAKYDGTTLTIIPSPAGYTANLKGYLGTPIVVGTDLYMQYIGNDGNYDLAKYDGTALTIIPSPTGYTASSRGYFGNPIVVGTDLYMRYRRDDGNFDLAKYDGTTLTIIPSPAGYTANGSFNSIVVGTDLYMQYLGDDGNYDLAKYDGTTLTIIPSPAGYTANLKGYLGTPIVVGTDLYMQYIGNDGNYDLAKYDGTALTIIPSPVGYENGSAGYLGNPIVVGTDLYMRYWKNDGNFDLAKYDGTALTIIPSPAGYTANGKGYSDTPIVVGTDLYMRYQGDDDNYDLAKYDGTTLTIIPSPVGYENGSVGYLGNPIVVGTDLYMQYIGNDYKFNLAKYDGISLTIIPSPTGYENALSGYYGNPIVVGTDLYLQYADNNSNYDLMKYNTVPPQTDFYVKTGGNDANTGADFSTAFATLQKALDEATAGSKIYIAAGTYKPTVGVDIDGNSTIGAREVTFQIPDGVEVYGGFAGTETGAITQAVLDARDFVTNTTILSGDINGDDNVTGTFPNLVYNNYTENAYHVIYTTGVSSATKVDGLTISGGNANGIGIGNDTGGGMYNDNFSSPSLTYCTFLQNSGGGGGGMYNINSSPMLTNCSFSQNKSNGDGGGMHNDGSSSPSLTNCTFSQNNAFIDGGGMCNEDSSSPSLTNCTFSQNNAYVDGGFGGGGMYNEGSSSPILTNCTFSQNNAYANGAGGGILVFSFSASLTLTNCSFFQNTANGSLGGGGILNIGTPTLTNCTFSQNNATDGGGIADYGSLTLTNCSFSENTATSRGGGMYSESTSPIIRNSIFFGNTAPNGKSWLGGTPDVAYTLIEEATLPTGTNNGNNIFNQNPLFTNAATGDLTLQTGSPAIDAGNNAAIPVGVTTDLAGNPRTSNAIVDTGAYEFQGVITSPEINLVGNSISIPSGTTGTSTANNTAFGQTIGTPISKTFAIQNTGTGALNVSSVTSSNPRFVVSNAPSSVIVNGQTEFTVTFTPTVQGIQTSTITINSNDADESVYTFNVSGEGICPTTTSITASTATVLTNQVGSIRVESQLGVSYQLQNVSNGNSNVGNPMTGTGGVIYLQTNQLTTTTDFRVIAIRGLDCGNQTLNTVSIAVSGSVNAYGYEQTQINDCLPSSTIADIDVKINGSTYLWNNATTNQDLTNVADGIYSLSIDGTTTIPVIVGSPVEWQDPIRATLTNEGRIVANGTYPWNLEAAATSKAILESGENGGFTIVVEDMATISNVMVGLTQRNNVSSYASLGNSFYIAPNGDLYIYWNDFQNMLKTTTPVVLGDRITILREGTSVKYYHNQNLVYTDTQAANATKTLVVDIALTTGTSPQVWFSKCNPSYFDVKYSQTAIDACNTGAGEGSITLYPQAGTAPYSYTWANGAAPIANPTGMQNALTSVQVTDANNYSMQIPVIIGTPVNWTSLQNVSASQGQLVAKGASGYETGGAISETGMGANTNGGITYIYQATSAGYMFGLSPQNTNPSWTSLGYSVYIENNIIYIYEGSNLLRSSVGVADQDRISIIRVGSDVIYYRNSQELHRISVDPSVNLFADATVATGQTPVIYASWCTTVATDLGLTYMQTAVDDCTTGGAEGAISLQGNGGNDAYTYTWNDANTDNPRSGLARGLYEVTVASGATNFTSPVIVGGFVNWADLTANTTQVGGTITATTPANWTTPAAGLSSNRLAASTDGGISFVITTMNGVSNYQIGLSSITATDPNWENIGYSVWINSQNLLRIYESSIDQNILEAVTLGDRISIIRKNGNVEYYINSKLIRATTTGTITQELAADIAIVDGTSPTVYASFCNPGFRIPNKVQASQNETHFEENTFSIYPNPSTGIFNVRFGTVLAENAQVTIFDAIGRKIQTQTFEKGNQKFSIDLKNQPKGMYLILFNQNGATYSKTIIIE